MKSKVKLIALSFFLSFFYQIIGSSQDLVLPDNFPKYEFPYSNSPDEGYLFITSRPQASGKMPAWMQIVDNYGTPVFYRFMPYQTGSLSIHDNGMLVYNYTIGETTKIYIMDSSFVVIDSVGMEGYNLDTHDYLVMENGHYLIFGSDLRIVDMSQYIEGGDPIATVNGFVIQELDENKMVVFEWSSWDHFAITDTYKDLTSSTIELAHPNSIDLDYDGNILLISRSMNEITKIDRQTGDIIWRLGGKNNQFDFADTSHMFSFPHSFRLISNGNYTLFDNGQERDPAYSRAIEYSIDQENKTIEMVWEYDAGKSVYGRSGGSVQRLPSGNTILCYGGNQNDPSMIEVHSDGSKAWQLNYTDANSSGGVRKYPWRTTLFELSTYSVNLGEYEYVPIYYLLTVKNNAEYDLTLTGYSTHTDAFSIMEDFPITITANGETNVTIVYEPDNLTTGYITDVMTINSDINSDTLVQRVAQQVKLKGTQEDFTAPTGTITLALNQYTPQDTLFYIAFNEAIRLLNDDLVTYENVDQLITVRLNNENGSDVPFTALVSTDKCTITIIPSLALDPGQTFYVSISNGYEDYSGNQGNEISATFAGIDFTPPEGSITPGNGSTDVDLDPDITIQFDEPVRNSNNSELVDINLDTLVIFKLGDKTGSDIPFSATINPGKTTITVTPVSSLLESSSYYIAIWKGVEDYYNNQLDTVYSIFTTGIASSVPSDRFPSLQVYPNPGNGIFYVQFEDDQERTIRVTDMVGKVILRRTNLVNNFILDLSDKPNNIYLLFIEEQETGKSVIRKLIKQ